MKDLFKSEDSVEAKSSPAVPISKALPVPTGPQIARALVTVKLDIDFDSSVEKHGKEKFGEAFSKDVAETLKVSADDVKIKNILRGSVIVEFSLSSPKAIQAMRDLEKKKGI